MSLTTRDAFDISPDETGRRHLRVELTPTDVATIVVALQAVLVATVVLGLSGQPFALLRAVIGVGTLAVLTGALSLGVLGVTPASRSSFVAYAVGASVAIGMGYGLLVNFGLDIVGVEPVTPVPMTVAIAALVCGLAGLYAREHEDVLTYSLDLDELWSPLWLGLALLPFLGIYGGLALTAFDSNTLLLVLYAAIVGVVALVLTDQIPARALPAVVWLVAIALLLQNTLSGNYLAWGDQPKEANLAMIVLENGFWTPNTPAPYGNKFGMLRIVLLHPIYRVVTGLDLVWIFKLVHPLVFSVAPVALLQAYRTHVDDETAFLSVFLFVSLFSFFIVLSRNTRTATALLFLALLAMLVSDRVLDGRHRKLLAVLFALSVVVCHYGVSYIVLAVLPGVVVLTKVFDYVYGDQTVLSTSPRFVALYGVGTFAWYSYLVPGGKATGTLFGFLEEFVRRVQTEFLSPEASATTRVVANDWGSSTLRVLKFYNVAIGGLIGLGILAVLLRRFVDDERRDGFDNEYLAYAVCFLGIFGVTFLPVERFNTARTYPTALLFFAPFFVVGVRAVWETAGEAVGQLRVSRATLHRVAAVVLVGFFLLNTGFVSATVTHEYSTNVMPEKERIMTDGRPVEAEYFYKQYPTVYESRSSEWLQIHASDGATVYQGGWPGGLGMAFGYERHSPDAVLADIDRRAIRGDAPIREGYVFLSPFEHLTDTVSFPGGHFEYTLQPRSEVESKWQDKHKVYDNGGSAVYR